MKKRILIALAIVLPILLLLPLVASAATNAEIIDILNAGISGLVKLVEVAYCAAGVAALC